MREGIGRWKGKIPNSDLPISLVIPSSPIFSKGILSSPSADSCITLRGSGDERGDREIEGEDSQ